MSDRSISKFERLIDTDVRRALARGEAVKVEGITYRRALCRTDIVAIGGYSVDGDAV